MPTPTTPILIVGVENAGTIHRGNAQVHTFDVVTSTFQKHDVLQQRKDTLSSLVREAE